MGTSVITVRVVGNHGCQREVKDHGFVTADCGNPSCVDCAARRFVKELGRGNSVTEAHLLHWPDSSPHILDDLKTGQRTGNF